MRSRTVGFTTIEPLCEPRRIPNCIYPIRRIFSLLQTKGSVLYIRTVKFIGMSEGKWWWDGESNYDGVDGITSWWRPASQH